MGRIVVPPAFTPPYGFATFPLFFKVGAGWGYLGSRCNGRIPGSLTVFAKSGDFALQTPARATTQCCDLKIAPQGTGGEFTAWLPASHQTSRSLNSYADTCLRAGLS